MKWFLKVGSEGIDTNIYHSDIRFYNNIYLMISESFPKQQLPKSIFLCDNFPNVHFLKRPILKSVLTLELSLQDYPSRSAWPLLQHVVPQNCHLGSALEKVP